MQVRFSFVYSIKDRLATIEEAEELTNRLNTLQIQWMKIGLSMTPKFHILMGDLVRQIQVINGYITMGEDRIEQNHQERACENTRNSKLRCKIEVLGISPIPKCIYCF